MRQGGGVAIVILIVVSDHRVRTPQKNVKEVCMKKRLATIMKINFSLVSATVIVVFFAGCGTESFEDLEYPEPYTYYDENPSDLDAPNTYSLHFYRDKRKRKKVDVDFNMESYGSTCQKTNTSKQHPNKIIVRTDKCANTAAAEMKIIDWIKNNVMGIGWPPPAWSKRYLATYYRRSTWGGRVDIPDMFKFVIWGDFNVWYFPDDGENYKCEAVMLGFTVVPRSDFFDTTGYYWTFITNTGSEECYNSVNGFTSTLPIECINRRTGSTRLLKIGFTDNAPGVSKEPDGFTIELCD